jgi:hypothetical protein
MKNQLNAVLLFLFMLLPFGMISRGQPITEGREDEPQGKTELSLRIVKARQYMQSVQMVFELSNQMEWLKHCWIGVSFYDHDGEFLYRELPLMYTSLPKGRRQLQEVWLESTDINDIGTVVIRPMLLETNLRELQFENNMLQLETEKKYPFKLVFLAQE